MRWIGFIVSGSLTNSISLTIGPLSSRDEVMLSRAKRMALYSVQKHRHGAIVYKSGRVISGGVNSLRNQHPTMEIDKRDYTRHAEINAIMHIDKEVLQGSTIYIARINKRGEALCSAPCRNCLIAIESAGIKRIVHT